MPQLVHANSELADGLVWLPTGSTFSPLRSLNAGSRGKGEFGFRLCMGGRGAVEARGEASSFLE